MVLWDQENSCIVLKRYQKNSKKNKDHPIDPFKASFFTSLLSMGIELGIINKSLLLPLHRLSIVRANNLKTPLVF